MSVPDRRILSFEWTDSDAQYCMQQNPPLLMRSCPPSLSSVHSSSHRSCTLPPLRSPYRWIEWARRRTECSSIILTVLQRRQRRTLSSVFWGLRHRVLTKVGMEVWYLWEIRYVSRTTGPSWSSTGWATALWRCLHTGVLVSACRYCVTLKMILFCRRPATLKVCPA